MKETIPEQESTLELIDFRSRVSFLSSTFSGDEADGQKMFANSTLIPRNIFNNTPVVDIAKDFLIRIRLFSLAEGPKIQEYLQDFFDNSSSIPFEESKALDKVYEDTYLEKYFNVLNAVVLDYSMDAAAVKLRELKNFLNVLVSVCFEQTTDLNERS